MNKNWNPALNLFTVILYSSLDNYRDIVVGLSNNILIIAESLYGDIIGMSGHVSRIVSFALWFPPLVRTQVTRRLAVGLAQTHATRSSGTRLGQSWSSERLEPRPGTGHGAQRLWEGISRRRGDPFTFCSHHRSLSSMCQRFRKRVMLRAAFKHIRPHTANLRASRALAHFKSHFQKILKLSGKNESLFH